MSDPQPDRPRILIVDDEEAILETMTFTFEDDYEVLTSASAAAALEMIDGSEPVSVVISDQRMPEMTGVEFLAEVFQRHPSTVRIILTGFADMDAIIGSINDGHVYAYITKPWEPDDLKQVVRRAVEHYQLTVENQRLLEGLRDSNVFLQAVMDQLDTAALAVDADGRVRAANRPARDYLHMEGDPLGKELSAVLGREVLEKVVGSAIRINEEADTNFAEIELPEGDMRLRIGLQGLQGPDGRQLGSVILAREISHEPLNRCFDEIVTGIAGEQGEVRQRLLDAQTALKELATRVQSSGTASPGMSELSDRTSRTLTAIDYWLAVDHALAREEFPDAQPLLDRMRLANARWPLGDRLPERVQELARRVESYYESGENPKQPVL